MNFPSNDIISLLDERLELNLAERTNKDLVLEEIWDKTLGEVLKELKLEYGTSQGIVELRELVGKKLQVDKKNILITREGKHMYGGLTKQVNPYQFQPLSGSVAIKEVNIPSPDGKRMIALQTLLIEDGLIKMVDNS